MTTTWDYPVHTHPWFRKPSQKRKACQEENISLSTGYSDYNYHDAHAAKRLKCGALESGFAQLSLNASSDVGQQPQRSTHGASAWSGGVNGLETAAWVRQPVVKEAVWDATPVNPHTSTQPTFPVVLPGSVEEPVSPEEPLVQDLPDVTMKSRSWYEPEKDRIVILDLDDSDVEDTPHDDPQVSVNSALLDHLKRHQQEPDFPPDPVKPSAADANMALVLFKPLPIPEERDGLLSSHTESATGVQSGDVSFGSGLQVDGPVEATETNAAFVDPSHMDVDDAMEVE